jgi:uncharacterized membrane protein YbaN (DUF454 family)
VCVELNSKVTLLNSMLLTYHEKIERITRMLIALRTVGPHLRNYSEAHKLKSKLRLNTLRENCSSLSILIILITQVSVRSRPSR